MNIWYILIFIFFIFIVIGFIIFFFSEEKTHSNKNYKRNKVSKKSPSPSSLPNNKKWITKEEKKELLENTKEFIKENSETASKVIRNWLKE